jgi:protein-S-isoprenylcysteine O-methyltransferase Ste14
MVAIAAVCTIRLLFPSHYGLCGPIAPAAIRVVFVAGLLLTVAGFGIALVAQSQMGRSWRIGIPGERTALVTAGLYRTVRNPIYSGFLAATLGLLLMLPSIATMAILVASAVVISRWVAREEMHQLKIHGDSYREYCKTAGRYLPRLR